MPSPSPALPRARWRRAVAAVGAVVLSSTLVGGGLFAAQTTATAAPAATVVPTAVTATGTATSVAKVAGKAQGSGKWGFVGDVESYDGKATSTYGVAVSPLDGSLWVTDSGKVVFSTFGCALLGFSGVSSCQSGSPGVLHYPATGTAGTDYLGNGGFKAATSAASAGVNAGVGAQYAPLAEAGRIDYPGPGTATEMRQHGPRGIAVTDDGVAWYADSEAIAPLGGPGGTMGRADKDMNVLPGAGYTAPWGQHREPGVTLYHSGAAIDSQGRVWTNSETADRMVIFNADGTPNGEMPLDLVFPDTGKPDYRNPTSVAIDKADDSVYVPLINFRDDKLMGPSPFLEKRDKAGNVIAKFTAPNFPKNQVVMGAAVDPVTRHVFAWTQSNTGAATAPAVMEWTKDGEFVAQFGTADVPELSTVRGMSFDKNGYRYLTVNEGSTRTRVVIMAQTPEPVTTACAPRSADGTSVKLSWDCEGPTAEGDSYGQAPVLDYVVEQREVGTTAWSVVPHAASTEKTRTIDGLDPTKEYEFRISAWNEAGNGDWASVTSPVADPQDDAISAAFGGTGSIDALANDTFGASVDTSTLTLLDAAGQPATAVTIEGQGSYELSGSTVTFVPVAGFTGKADPVTYRVTSDVDCYVTAQVTATVGAPATLTLTKKVDGDEGAAEASAWTLTATGEGDAKASGTTGEAAVTEAKLPAGNYALSEEGPTLGYASDGFVCTTDGGDAAPASHAVVLEAGTATECVVTNSYKAPVTTSPTPTETETPTPTETETPTPTETETPTPTETETPTPTETETPTPTETETPTPTETETPTPTETETPTPTETETPSPTPTETETPTPTETETGAPTESGSGTPTSSPSSSDEPSTTTPGSPSTSAAPSQSTTSASTPAPTHGGSTDSTPSSSSPSALPNTGFGSGWMLALAVAIIAAAVAMMTVGRPRRRH